VRDQEDDKIAALDNGADDYLTKPFGTGRIARAFARRAAPRPAAADEAVFKRAVWRWI
jgi:two-component system, OmpR family, KDP operon response regulator KdpE